MSWAWDVCALIVVETDETIVSARGHRRKVHTSSGTEYTVFDNKVLMVHAAHTRKKRKLY